MEESFKLVRAYYSKIARECEESKYFDSLPLNRFWSGENLEMMRSIISNAAALEDVIHLSQKTFMFSVNSSDPIKERAVDWLLSELCSRKIDLCSLPTEIQESSYSFPGNKVLRENRALTPDFLRTVNISMEIEKHIQRGGPKLRIVEIGGGLGHLARTMRLMGVSCSHLIIDLPETLVFSYSFLRMNFPDMRFLLVSDSKQVPEIEAGLYDFAFVPVHCAGSIINANFDLFVNTASMGEMRNETIRHWMNYIQNRLRIRYLFTLNRYLNTINPHLHAWRWAENECSVHYDQFWRILKWELEPSYTRCPYLDTLVARYVMIIAERVTGKNVVECMAESQALAEEIKQQDWYRLPQESGVMTMGENILVHDMNTSGTLFKLWEAIRLYPSADLVAMLLRYLRTLLKYEEREFEEVKYYEELFLTLYKPMHDLGLSKIAEDIDQCVLRRGKLGPVNLVGESATFNFVHRGERYLAVAKMLGPTDLFVERLGERELSPFVLLGNTLDEVQAKAADLEHSSKLALP